MLSVKRMESRRAVALTGGRALAFCWPRTVDLFVGLAEHLRDRHRLDCYVVTSRPAGKLRLTRAGFHAFTIRELYAATHSRPCGPVDSAELDDLARYDQVRGWRWLPADECPDPGRAQPAVYCRWMAERVLAAYELMFEAVQPDVVLTWNGVALLQKAPVHLAEREGVPCFFLERGLLPDTLVVDPQGVNYASHIGGDGWLSRPVPEPTADEAEQARRYCRALTERRRSVVNHGRDASERAVREALAIPPDSRVVLLPLQLEQDSNILYNSPHYKTMPDIIRDVAGALAHRDDVVTVIKSHPEDGDRLAELRALCGDRVRLSHDLSLHALLDVADVVVTVTSTVGLEALTQGKPVVVLGLPVYAGKGFTHDLDRPDALPGLLGRALADAEQGRFEQGAFLRFLVYLLKSCLFRLDGDDQWGSRERIGRRIHDARLRRPSGRAAWPPEFARLLVPTGHLMDLQREADVDEPRSVLWLGARPEWFDEFAASLVDCRLEVLGESQDWRRQLEAHYDYAIACGPLSRDGLSLWRTVQARHKLHMV